MSRHRMTALTHPAESDSFVLYDTRKGTYKRVRGNEHARINFTDCATVIVGADLYIWNLEERSFSVCKGFLDGNWKLSLITEPMSTKFLH